MKKTVNELIAASAFLALGVFWFVESFSVKVTALNSSVAGTPRTYPQIVSILIIVVAAIMIAELLIRLFRERRAVNDNAENSTKESPKRFLGVLIVVAASILYCVFIDTLTYLPASIILMAVVAYCFEIRKPLPLILLTVLVPAILFVVFRYLLVVPLP